MRKLALLSLAALAVAFTVRGEEDKDARAALTALFAEAKGAIGKAKDRGKVRHEYADKFLAHAEKHPKDPSAVDALVYVTQLGQREGKARGKALELLAGDVGKQVAVRRHLKGMAADPFDDETLEVVVGLAKSHPDETTRAYACRALLKGYEARYELASRYEADSKVREQAEQSEGKEAVKHILDRAPNARVRGKQYRKLLDTKYPDMFPVMAPGKPMPELLAEDLDGKKVKLSELKGKVVVVDIWATWCGPCKAMIPHEQKMVKKLQGKPFALVSVSVDAKKDTVKQFVKTTPMPWTHWHIGPDSDYLDRWEVPSFPTIYVVDAKGVIRYKNVRDKALEEAVEALLKEVKGEE